MTLPEEGQLLRIFIGESDKYGRQPLYEWIVRKAREFGLAGATVFRGLEGFGAHSRVHTAKILRLSSDLPIVIEIVDTPEKIEQFMPIIDDAIKEVSSTMPSRKAWRPLKKRPSDSTGAENEEHHCCRIYD
jgi:PII-like signaling protein